MAAHWKFIYDRNNNKTTANHKSQAKRVERILDRFTSILFLLRLYYILSGIFHNYQNINSFCCSLSIFTCHRKKRHSNEQEYRFNAFFLAACVCVLAQLSDKTYSCFFQKRRAWCRQKYKWILYCMALVLDDFLTVFQWKKYKRQINSNNNTA